MESRTTLYSLSNTTHQAFTSKQVFSKHRAIEMPPSMHASVTNRNVTRQCSRHYSTPLPVCEIISQVCWSANDATCLGRRQRMSQSLIWSSQLWGTSTVLREEWWQGWPSGESTCLPPMWPGFDFRTRRHMWVEFVCSLLCYERFSPGYSGFPLSPKTNI